MLPVTDLLNGKMLFNALPRVIRRDDGWLLTETETQKCLQQTVPLKCINISPPPRSVLFLYTDGRVGSEDGLSFTSLRFMSRCCMT